MQDPYYTYRFGLLRAAGVRMRDAEKRLKRMDVEQRWRAFVRFIFHLGELLDHRRPGWRSVILSGDR